MNSVIKDINKKDKNFFKLITSTVLGIACGTGWMTSIRLSRIGISEILFLILITILAFLYKNDFFKIKNNLANYIKIFLFLIFFVIIPYKTLFTNVSGHLPENLIIYNFSYFVFFFLLIALEKKIIDLNFMVVIFAVVLLSTLFYFLAIEDLIFQNKKLIGNDFLGLSKNPNQYCFYLSCLLLFVSLYNKKFFFHGLSIIFFLSMYFKSDAFFVSSIFSIISLVLLYLINFFFKKNTVIIFFMLCTCLIFILFLNKTQLLIFTVNYFDGAEIRILLIKNGLLSVSHHPFFGNGVGSFAGHLSPFESYESHNSFIDFASQFGIIFSLLLFSVFLISLYFMIVNKNFFSASSLIGFLVFISFHYVGRHFIFYVILAILCNYIANYYKSLFFFSRSKGVM
jgi:hypothetical protein